MNDFLTVVFIVVFLFSINFIGYYTSKLRKLEKNQKYNGFIVEVLLKNRINNDILPIHINYKFNENYRPEFESMYKNRNYWVIAFWLNLILFVISFVIEKSIN